MGKSAFNIIFSVIFYLTFLIQPGGGQFDFGATILVNDKLCAKIPVGGGSDWKTITVTCDTPLDGDKIEIITTDDKNLYFDQLSV